MFSSKKARNDRYVEDDGNSDQSRSSSSRKPAVPAEVQAKGSKKHFPQGIKLFSEPETPGSCNMEKTQIAIDYVYRSKKEFAQQSIFWIHASSHDRFTQAFTDIAKELQIPGRDDPSADILLLVKSWLARSENGSWLMVLDNADDAEIFFDSQSTKAQPSDNAQPLISGSLRQHVPDCSHGSLLVTTRDKATGTKITTNRSRSMIKIAEMDPEEPRRLICAKTESLDSAQENEIVDLLAKRLHHIPLALAQASAYIVVNSIDIAEYLEILDESEDSMVELLSEPYVPEGRDSGVPIAVAATWIVSFKQIQKKTPEASTVLSTICWFDRQGIQKDLLQSCLLKEGDLKNRHSSFDQTKALSTPHITKAIGVLKAFSFVTEGPDKSLTIHRLIQLVTRKWLQQEKQSAPWLGRAILVLQYIFPYKDLENEKRKTCLELLPHALSVLSIDEVGVSSDIVPSRCELQDSVALTLYVQGRHKEAERIALEVVKAREKILGCDHYHTLNSKSILALTQYQQGKYKEAEAHYTAVLQVKERVYGLENPSTLSAMYNLGKLYEQQGQYQKAQELQSKVLERKTKLGPGETKTLRTMLAVASLYGRRGRFKDAKKLQAEALEICKRSLDPEHPRTLACMNNLALTYKNQGQYQDAEKLQLGVLHIRKKNFGLEDPETLKAMGNLATTYSAQSKYEDAEKIQTEVLKSSKLLFGNDSPATLLDMNNLASIYRGQGRYQEAKKLALETLEGRQRVLGKDHTDTLTAMNNLANTLKRLGSNQEALKLMRECVRLRIERYGEDFFDECNPREGLRILEEEALELDDGGGGETHL
ncbi:hypothetical protein HYALB_00001955 [Hymenoscyphus albidus]|uniref:DUF7779 domain-containing protein n=1 Tax=Hymenoscyphus albidus TaxID=595503 RepID=A0A9N9LGE2_9HELO|nr:hypothetical protein HYALB_00001955 [Hymenoscyphus albidus]